MGFRHTELPMRCLPSSMNIRCATCSPISPFRNLTYYPGRRRSSLPMLFQQSSQHYLNAKAFQKKSGACNPICSGLPSKRNLVRGKRVRRPAFYFYLRLLTLGLGAAHGMIIRQGDCGLLAPLLARHGGPDDGTPRATEDGPDAYLGNPKGIHRIARDNTTTAHSAEAVATDRWHVTNGVSPESSLGCLVREGKRGAFVYGPVPRRVASQKGPNSRILRAVREEQYRVGAEEREPNALLDIGKCFWIGHVLEAIFVAREVADDVAVPVGEFEFPDGAGFPVLLSDDVEAMDLGRRDTWNLGVGRNGRRPRVGEDREHRDRE